MSFEEFLSNVLTPFFSVVRPVDVIIWLFIIPVIILFFKAMLISFDVKELFNSDVTGKASHTKLWTNIAYLASTIAFLHINLHFDSGSLGDLSIIWFVYLAVVAGNNVASKWLSLKYNQQPEQGKD